MYGEAVNSPGTDTKCERALNQRLAISIAAANQWPFMEKRATPKTA